jgi:hypothetical protein
MIIFFKEISGSVAGNYNSYANIVRGYFLYKDGVMSSDFITVDRRGIKGYDLYLG